MDTSLPHSPVPMAGSVVEKPPRQPRGALFSLSRYSLRVRLIAIVLAVDCVAAVLLGGVIILKARTSTRLEIASSIQLADLLVADATRLLADDTGTPRLENVPLPLRSLRHVKITVTDNNGRVMEASRQPAGPNAGSIVGGHAGADTYAEAPRWFNRLIAPPIESKIFPIIVRQQHIGAVTVESEPGDEIDEAWTYARSVMGLVLGVNLATLVALYLLFGRALAPLTRLGAGLRELEGKNYAVHLPRPSSRELGEITDHFNTAAAALLAANQANRDLNRKLLTAHDDERRRTALELHDDVGPCLFALEASAASIAALTQGREADARLFERAQDVVSLVQTVQRVNRQVLDGLRPMALGQVPLRDCIHKVLLDFGDGADDGTGPAINHRFGAVRDSYGVIVDLTFYRCAREGLLNAARHARAHHVLLTFGERMVDSVPCLEMRIEDDGKGFDRRSRRAGMGLSGMRERVEALSGWFDLTTSADGTALTIRLPLAAIEELAQFPSQETA
ncbi:histidine kinase [Nitrospirillum viridazoti]|uniref:Oxygen sensor histidine kinase NreB n=1 Tax=Nitrospirillum viridazoti CBAmc TaxID=1441467 RepID=A0A248K0P0_9PROT|nr:histidine kinase [Nitrospirillum amazonense]ASG24380.1 ATPase [Nitrospirillum amazonense CBAmc]